MKPLHQWTTSQLCWLPIIAAMMLAAIVCELWAFVRNHEFSDS